MKITTSYIGEVEYDENDVVTFPKPILGFDNLSKYIFVGEITEEFPFVWLQSIEDESVVFIVTNPFLFVESYDFNIQDDDLSLIETDKIEDIEVLTMIVIPENIKDITTNLRSPIIVNKTKKIATQVILEEDYNVKHKLFNKE